MIPVFGWKMSYKGLMWMRGHDIIPRDWFRPSWGWFRWSAIISKAIRLDPILVKNHLFCFIKGQWAKSSDGAENLFPDLPPYEWNDRIQKSIKNSKLTSLFLASQDALEVMLVSQWVTDSKSRVDWCDPGKWRYLEKSLLMWLWRLIILMEIIDCIGTGLG